MRPVMQVAEPQVVGLTPQTTVMGKADTMKTYILRSAQTVQRQSRRAPAATADIAATVFFKLL